MIMKVEHILGKELVGGKVPKVPKVPKYILFCVHFNSNDHFPQISKKVWGKGTMRIVWWHENTQVSGSHCKLIWKNVSPWISTSYLYALPVLKLMQTSQCHIILNMVTRWGSWYTDCVCLVPKLFLLTFIQ